MATEYTDLSWIFDVQTKGDATWTPYTRENFPLPNPLEWWNSEHLGTSTCSPTDAPAERLTEELANALAPIRIRVGPDMSGLRIRMWKDAEPDGDPDLIMEATKPQLALADLRAAADPVHRARHELDNAKYRLRFTMTTLLSD
uniref:hypothetical protein n=1 Tax=Nocardiopsis synnemataformans TaxID=61305 RepID=UPI003EBCC3C8